MKKLFTVLAMLCVALSLFANGQSEAAAPEGPVTIKVANYALLESGYEAFWKGVKTGFEAAHPEYQIEWVTAPYGEIVNTVINMAGGGDKVDVIFGESSWVPGFEDAGLACPITDVLSESFVKEFYPSVLDTMAIDGVPYGVPLYITPYILYYNTELFKQAGLDPNTPPTTYDEMLEYAGKLSKLKDKNGNKIYAFGQTTASVPVSGSALTSMIFNFGGDILTADGKLSVDNQGFHDAFEMLALLDEKGYNPQNAKLKDLRNLFALGQLAMYCDQSWGFNGVQSINPDAKTFTRSGAPLKGGNGDGVANLSAHAFILVDNGPARREATDAFVQYVISKDVLSEYLTTITPAFPAKTGMDGMVSEILAGAAPSVANVKSPTSIPQLSDINLELCTLAQGVTVSNKDVDVAIAEFVKNASLKLQ